MTALVIVQGRWPWQRKDFFSEGKIEVEIIDGILKIVADGETHIYNLSQWRTVTSKNTPSRSRV